MFYDSVVKSTNYYRLHSFLKWILKFDQNIILLYILYFWKNVEREWRKIIYIYISVDRNIFIVFCLEKSLQVDFRQRDNKFGELLKYRSLCLIEQRKLLQNFRPHNIRHFDISIRWYLK